MSQVNSSSEQPVISVEMGVLLIALMELFTEARRLGFLQVDLLARCNATADRMEKFYAANHDAGVEEMIEYIIDRFNKDMGV